MLQISGVCVCRLCQSEHQRCDTAHNWSPLTAGNTLQAQSSTSCSQSRPDQCAANDTASLLRSRRSLGAHRACVCPQLLNLTNPFGCTATIAYAVDVTGVLLRVPLYAIRHVHFAFSCEYTHTSHHVTAAATCSYCAQACSLLALTTTPANLLQVPSPALLPAELTADSPSWHCTNRPRGACEKESQEP